MLKTVASNELKEIIKAAQKRKQEILNSGSIYSVGGTVYYVDCENGSDDNDGLTEKTAFKTLEKVSDITLNSGDVVLFRRGQVFRGRLLAQSGVTYSAFGEGEKPQLCSSINASNPEDWVKTEVPNVWRYREHIHAGLDIGNIFMKNDTLWGIKVCVNAYTNERCDMGKNRNCDVYNGRSFLHRERALWNGVQDLKGDLEFWHNWEENYLYLNCPDGNPAEAFGTIEMTQRISTFCNKNTDKNDVTIDNICFKYGNFGISGFGNAKDFTIRNCVFSCIGGSTQFVEMYMSKEKTVHYGNDIIRLGNGIEIWGGCDGFTIENCYFEQIFDAAVTVQYEESPAKKPNAMKNVRWVNNVFDTCHYCFELWLTVNDKNGFKQELKDIEISGNFCFNNGYGWAQQRPDPGYTFYYGAGEIAAKADFENCAIHDNYFVNGKGAIVSAHAIGGTKMQIHNNKIYHNNSFGALKKDFDEKSHEFVNYKMTVEDIEILENTDFIGKNEYYSIDIGDIPEGNIIKI